MSLKQICYLSLAIAGLIGTWYFNIQFIQAGGTTLGFVRDGFANPAASSLSIDIYVACLTGIVFMIAEGTRLQMKHVWAYVIFALLIAFAFTFPLFLFMRERKLAAAS